MVGLFRNASLVTNIRQSLQTLHLGCNAGNVTITLVVNFKIYGTVGYYPKVITNILSLEGVKNIYRVTYDRTRGDYFVVHRGNGGFRWFLESLQGLYLLNTKDTNVADGTNLLNVDDNSNSLIISYICMSLINTVDDKISDTPVAPI